MRVYQSSKIVISKDNATNPQEIRFSSTKEVIDTTTVGESHDASGIYAVGTTVVPMGTIAAGELLIITPAADCDILVDGTESVSLKAGKQSVLWIDFTALSVVVTGVANQIDILIAGD